MKLSIYAILLLTILSTQSCSDESNAIVLNSDELLESRHLDLAPSTLKSTVNFVVIHSRNWTASSEFLSLLQTYGLKKEKAFDIDDSMAGFHLYPQGQLTNPLDIGKEISLFADDILMVEVNGIVKETTATF